jgi:DNA polymerase alpha subunit A
VLTQPFPCGAGTLYLFGKVQAPCQDGMEDEEPEFVSCCVKISKVDRNMYVVPRKMLQDPAGNDTDEPAEIVNLDNPNCVYHEFKRKMDAHRIPVAGCVKGVPVKRFCTFDNADVPRGMHDCLKFKCPAGVSSLPKDTWSGQSYSHIVGAETSCVEQLLIRRKIMGPCWLRIGNATPCNSPFSWCKVEFQTNGMKGISVAEEHRNTPPPKLRVMSLSLKTVFNESKRQNEVIMASTTVVNNVSAEAATPEWERNSDTRVILRAPEHRALPLDLRETIRSKSMPIEVQPSERVLLNCLFARIHRADPDIVVAHNIMAFDLEVLLNRGAKNKCANWDRIGRLRRRNQAPKLKGGGAQGAALAKYAAGRLLCDTYLSARDLVRQTTYTLTSLCQIQLGVSRDAVESEDVPKHFSDTKNLLGLAHHTAKDTRLVLALMTHLQIVPLTKQLTNLAGNLWARTLRGGKAERNEFLLLHEFYRARHSGTDAKFLLPDKKGYSNKPGEPKGRRTRKKAAYAGGLVLEPKKGFYDNMILLLDFNSLYPSIIREYNICFTTVPEQQQTEEGEEDVLPDLPSDSPKGILPRVIKTLIDSRSAVKGELKKAKEGTARYQQLDIRQMALKLTANSMYGCLGFTFSRFYAKPLAMLITAQGRSLLQRSKEITETSLGLEVVYGDTDSIMVNTRSNNYEEAIAKGREVLKKINEGYKCVELDIDGVFSNMLLLKKKKYAAMMIQGRGSDGQMMFSRKTSGLDMVRRDWCPISKEVSGYVLDRLLGGRSREDAVENIHTYLREIGENIQTQSWEGFVITKSITKMPHEYTDAKSQPHVQVAIKMIQANEQVQAGQEIQYLVLEGNSSSVTDRCVSPKEFVNTPGAKIDYAWYLATQVHPPISRLCEVIEGTDSARIADCLGKGRHCAWAGVCRREAGACCRSGHIEIPDNFRLQTSG